MRRYFDADDDRCETCFGQLTWIIDGIRIQHDESHRSRRIEYPVYLALGLSCEKLFGVTIVMFIRICNKIYTFIVQK